MSILTINVPDELLAELEPYKDHLDDVLRLGLKELKLSQGLVVYRQGQVSLWKAARLAGVSLREMTRYAKSQGLEPVIDEATLQEELA